MKATIIDGNNLLHKIEKFKKQFLKDKETAQRSLIESVRSHFRKNEKVIFVFDGFGNFKKQDVIFSNEETADDVIRRLTANSRHAKLLKIVSSDQSIIDFAKVCGCETSKSEEFWTEITKHDSPTKGKNINQNYIYDKLEKPERLSKKEIDEFKKYFT